MRCTARYTGTHPMLGVQHGNTYTLDIQTYSSEHGTPYLWVRAQEAPQYLMPYESMVVLMMDWDFRTHVTERDTPYLDHLDLVDAWLDVYMPGEAVTVK